MNKSHNDKFILRGTAFGLLMGLGVALSIGIGYFTDYLFLGIALSPVAGMITGILVGHLVKKED
jgi:hypothetical protein